jgi:Tfp pilus assembly protein PilF
LRRALEYAAENVRRQNNNSELLGTLGWILFKMKEIDQASKVLQQAAASGNINSQTAYFLARLAFSKDQKDQAKQLLDAALKSNRPFPKRHEAKTLMTELSK